MANKIKSLKIKDDLFLNIMSVEIPKTIVNDKEVEIVNNEPSNQFLIFDRSGSMYGYLDTVMNSAIKYVNLLPEGSTVSLGYFSGTDEYALTVPYILKKELSGAITTINSYRNSIGLTNFIQILDKLNSVAGNIKSKSSLFFFTDGCHNTGGGRAEIERILTTWKEYAGITMFVGYGYIDREMMSWMAQVSEGSFIHMDKFENFEKTLNDFGSSVEDLAPSVVIPFEYYDAIPVSISGRASIEYNVENKEIKFKVSKSGFKGLYFLTDYLIEEASVMDKMDINAERGIRALSLVHSQRNNVETSLDLLSYIGDKFLIRNLFDSISPDEFAKSETLIRKSVYSTKDRFLEGEVKNYLPDPNAFCIIDVINCLADDDSALLHTNDPEFEYSRTSKKTVRQDGPSVIYEDKGVYFNDIVMNKERLNLSISTMTDGIVDLLSPKFVISPPKKEELERLNIPQDYKVTSFKTYSIIVDGKLHVKKLVVSNLAKETLNIIGVYATRRKDGKYVIDLSNLPLINKTYVKNTSARELAKYIWQEKLLKEQISLFKYLKKTDVYKSDDVLSFSEEQKDYLLTHCYIKDGKYQPPMKTLTGTDQYEAYSFEIKMKGYSDVSASSIVKKMDENTLIQEGVSEGKIKNVTDRERIIEEAYNNFNNNRLGVENFDVDSYCKDQLKDLNKALKHVRKYIQTSKLAIILAKKGKMDEFTSRENQSLDVELTTLNSNPLTINFSFEVKKIVVDI